MRADILPDRMKRLLLLGVLVLYGSATASMPLADSLLESTANSHVDHIEQVSAPSSIGHDELTCPLCQFVGLASIACSDGCVGYSYLWRMVAGFKFSHSWHPTGGVSPLGPRAPPQVCPPTQSPLDECRGISETKARPPPRRLEGRSLPSQTEI